MRGLRCRCSRTRSRCFSFLVSTPSPAGGCSVTVGASSLSFPGSKGSEAQSGFLCDTDHPGVHACSPFFLPTVHAGHIVEVCGDSCRLPAASPCAPRLVCRGLGHCSWGRIVPLGSHSLVCGSLALPAWSPTSCPWLCRVVLSPESSREPSSSFLIRCLWSCFSVVSHQEVHRQDRGDHYSFRGLWSQDC